MLSLLLNISIVASGVGAFLGGYALVHPLGGAGLGGLGGSGPGVRALGGALLLSHAAALAALAQSPAVGACLAAGLGSAWFGGAAGRAIAAVVERRRGPGAFARIGFEAMMGIAMWAPLWGYLRLLRRAALPAAV